MVHVLLPPALYLPSVISALLIAFEHQYGSRIIEGERGVNNWEMYIQVYICGKETFTGRVIACL